MTIKYLSRICLVWVCLQSPAWAVLVYYVPFDDGTASSLANLGTAGGTATLGTVSANTPGFSTTNVAPNLGSAASEAFTGTSSSAGYVSLPNSSSQFLLDTAGEAMTVSLWVYWDGTAKGGLLSTTPDNNSSGWSLDVESNGTLKFSDVSTAGSASYTSTATIASSQWVNVSFTFQAGDANALSMYINGTLVKTGVPASGSLLTRAGTDIRLGVIMNRYSPLHGYLDDVAIWDQALNAGEIRAISTAPALLSGFNAGAMDELFQVYDTSTAATVDGIAWSKATGFDTTGHSAGDVWLGADGDYYAWFGGSGPTADGVMGMAAVPEPPAGLLLLLGAAGISCLRLPRRRAAR